MRHLSDLGRALPLLVLLMLALLAGCGQKGPLYLPGDEEAAATYDPGNAYLDGQADEQDDEAASESDDDDAETTPATSDGEG